MSRLAASVAAAVLYALLFPPFGAVWLSWVALVPLCLALRGARPRAAAGLGALFGWLTTLVIIAWLVPTLTGHFERSVPFALAFWLLFAATPLAPFCAAAFAGLAGAMPRLPAALRPFAFAAAWVTLELARTHLGVCSPWARLGDAHAGSARLRQLADVFGVYGVSGLVALGNAALAELGVALARHGTPPRHVRGALAGALASAALLVVALGYGSHRLAQLAVTEPGLRVTLAQAGEPTALRWQRAGALRVLARYAALTQESLARGPRPDLVVWPESALQIEPSDPQYAPSLRLLAGAAPLLLGAPRSEQAGAARRSFNSAWLLRPGAKDAVYDKRRLLLFSETHPFGAALALGAPRDLEPSSFSAGTKPGLFGFGSETLGVLICLEALYPGDARALAASGATLLVNLSNDGWYGGRGGAEQHFAQVVFRAVETRLPLVRSTSTGISAIVDARGEPLEMLGAGRAGALEGVVPRAPGARAPYVRLGDAFACCCAVLWLAAVLAGFAGGKRVSSVG